MRVYKVVSGCFILSLCLALATGCVQKPAIDPAPGSNAGQRALEALKRGNVNYRADKLKGVNLNKERRAVTAEKGQHPHALIFACSDSRVPAEAIFDQGVGDIFVVRVAGNVSSPAVLGSIQYAVHHLHVPLVVVMGHSGCSAVKSAWEGEKADGAFGQLIVPLQRASKKLLAENPSISDEDAVMQVTELNIKAAMEAIVKDNPGMATMIDQGDFMLKGAVYDIHSGEVRWLE